MRVVTGLCALALAFAPVFVVVMCHLQSQLQEHVLHRLQDDAGHALRSGRQFAQVDDSRHRQACALGADRGHQLFGIFQGQAADAVDFFGHHGFTWLQIGNHAQQLGPVSACP